MPAFKPVAGAPVGAGLFGGSPSSGATILFFSPSVAGSPVAALPSAGYVAPIPAEIPVGDADYLLLSELRAQQARGRHLSAKEQRKKHVEINEAIARFEAKEREKRTGLSEVSELEELPEYSPKPKKVDLKTAADRLEAHTRRIAQLEALRVQREIEDEEDEEEILWLLAA